jgi:N-sulfoglucosamine sulfohydrolase
MDRLFLVLGLTLATELNFPDAADRPNIIWVVGEDLGPEAGCYGDAHAITPHLDRRSSGGARFTWCFTHAL